MNYKYENSTFSIVCISGRVSPIIEEEHGIYMPCSSLIISEMTPQICYHSNNEITNWCAQYMVECYLDDVT